LNNKQHFLQYFDGSLKLIDNDMLIRRVVEPAVARAISDDRAIP
jgi:hypothetical protein